MERKQNMKAVRRKSFTLVEVVVVIAIMLLTGVIAAVTVRSESISTLMKRTSTDFRALCSHVRYKAMEMGQDRMVVYDPEKTMFYMARPVANMEEAMEYEEGFVILKDVKWKMPDEFELTTEDNHPIEVFRFYPDGGASGRWKMHLGCKGKDIGMTIEVAKLTGAVVVREDTQGQE